MKKNNVIKWTFLLAAIGVLTLPVQALAGEVYKLGLSPVTPVESNGLPLLIELIEIGASTPET